MTMKKKLYMLWVGPHEIRTIALVYAYNKSSAKSLYRRTRPWGIVRAVQTREESAYKDDAWDLGFWWKRVTPRNRSRAVANGVEVIAEH